MNKNFLFSLSKSGFIMVFVCTQSSFAALDPELGLTKAQRILALRTQGCNRVDEQAQPHQIEVVNPQAIGLTKAQRILALREKGYNKVLEQVDPNSIANSDANAASGGVNALALKDVNVQVNPNIDLAAAVKVSLAPVIKAIDNSVSINGDNVTLNNHQHYCMIS